MRRADRLFQIVQHLKARRLTTAAQLATIPGRLLTALMFTREEVETVVVGLRMAQAFGGPRLRAAAVPTLDKEILALPKERRAEIDGPQMYTPLFNAHRAIDGLLETTRMAIDNRAVLELRYADERLGVWFGQFLGIGLDFGRMVRVAKRLSQLSVGSCARVRSPW